MIFYNLYYRSEEGSDYNDDEDGDDGGDDGSQDSYDELTEEQKIERDLDDQNINIETTITGDELNYPMVGDIVRVRYLCTLVEGGTLLASTKTQIKKPSVEFALGFNQVIKGFDRALPRMSIGERAKLTFTPEYAYGKAGLFPNIPADAEITFDLTLLGFKPRAMWVKPLVQESSLCQQPYFENPNEAEEAFVQIENN
jgi:FK506-binding protein 1